MHNVPAPVAQFQPAASAGLGHIIGHCLAKDLDLRWQAAADVKLELQSIAEEKALGPVAAPSAPVVDIMEVLKKSLAAARKPVGRAEEATGEAKSQRRMLKRQVKGR